MDTLIIKEADDKQDLFESICLLVETYMYENLLQLIQPNFPFSVIKDVTELIHKTVLDVEANAVDANAVDANANAVDTNAEEIEVLVKQAIHTFYNHIMPERSCGNTFIRKKPNITKMKEKINYLTSVPQPEQRTPEWYEFRYKHLTASNIWKTFISESTRNQLIFEKCQPLTTEKYSGPPSLESPMHWGQKYEPLSVMLYEKIYKTKISDFGCIPHKTIDFLAASPDGINTLETSGRYGRMLEVKNIVNRDINGNPKMEYWIQMQVQMEVCNLNECDFLETRFTEYPDLESYANAVEANAVDTNAEIHKGIMMLFMKGNGQPLYEYMPLDLNKQEEEEWQEKMMEKNKEMNWLKNIYWKLDQLSCVLVLRNKFWFQVAALPQLETIWQTIETEKKSGYSHRAPKKNSGIRVKKFSTTTENIEMNSTCFITIDTTTNM